MSDSSQQQPKGMPDDRWQDLFRSVDPVANLNALADVWRQAAASSEQVVNGFVGENGTSSSSTSSTNEGPHAPSDAGFPLGGRDVRIDFERSVDQMADAAKRFFGQMPWGMGGASDSVAPTPSVIVLDGVGTTEISLPVSTSSSVTDDAVPWSTDLLSHDGSCIDKDRVTIRPTPTYGGEVDSATGKADDLSFIVKITVEPTTEAGIYHGQILCPGKSAFVLALEARVYNED